MTDFCFNCKKPITVSYGHDKDKNKICYECCADVDREYMKEHGKISLYINQTNSTVSNWPGSLKFDLCSIKKGHHNMSQERIDAWFKDDGGNWWWGVHYGMSNTIIHCKRIKNMRL
jgi:hypothetical protein